METPCYSLQSDDTCFNPPPKKKIKKIKREKLREEGGGMGQQCSALTKSMNHYLKEEDHAVAYQRCVSWVGAESLSDREKR